MDKYKTGNLYIILYKFAKMYILPIQDKKIEYFHIRSFFLYSQVKNKENGW